MKKLNLFLSLILILVMGTAASAQTVDDVISKATAAMGGQSAIDGVKSLKMSMTGTLQDKEIEFEVTILKPNNKMIKMNIMDMDIITATNGTDYWRSQMGQVKDMTVAAKEQFGSSFYQYSGASIAGLIGNGTFIYSGKEDVDGISADVVKGAFTGSGPVSMYFDATGLPFKMLMPNEEGDLHMSITDYRDVGGMLIAYKFESITNGESMMALEITEVEANIDIDPSIFAKPAQ
ncbi:MAG: hypothetical protein KOO60_02280 [Gemmatimonadales bacterium]|nr:hypothetical protein [Gemmatimonadales bacterium]